MCSVGGYFIFIIVIPMHELDLVLDLQNTIQIIRLMMIIQYAFNEVIYSMGATIGTEGNGFRE
jgi:hypothetical protein